MCGGGTVLTGHDILFRWRRLARSRIVGRHDGVRHIRGVALHNMAFRAIPHQAHIPTHARTRPERRRARRPLQR